VQAPTPYKYQKLNRCSANLKIVDRHSAKFCIFARYSAELRVFARLTSKPFPFHLVYLNLTNTTMNNSNPIQRALFAAVTQKFANQSAAIRDYRKHFNDCAESTARNRFNGINAVNYDHGMQVAARYGLHDLHVYPEAWPSTHFLVEAVSSDLDLDAYLHRLNEIFEQLRHEQQAKVFLTINKMPLLFLKRYRQLAGFLLYYTFVIDGRDLAFKNMSFGTDFLMHPIVQKWLDQCRSVLCNYQQIEGEEYWSPTMLNHFITKVKAAHRMRYIADDALFELIRTDIYHLVDDMKNTVKAGQKLIGPEKRGASVRIYNHQGQLGDNSLIVYSATHQMAYIEHNQFNLHHYCGTFADQYLSRLNTNTDILVELGRRPQNSTDFFDQLNRNVELSFEA
jgi:hypothetical protein